MWPFSYRRCATDIVYLAEKPSLRDASCWRVVVRNGAYGERRYGLRSTDLTEKSAPWRRSDSCAADSRWTTPGGTGRPLSLVAEVPSRYRTSGLRSSPDGAKSRPCATRRPSTATSPAGNED